MSNPTSTGRRRSSPRLSGDNSPPRILSSQPAESRPPCSNSSSRSAPSRSSPPRADHRSRTPQAARRPRTLPLQSTVPARPPGMAQPTAGSSLSHPLGACTPETGRSRPSIVTLSPPAFPGPVPRHGFPPLVLSRQQRFLSSPPRARQRSRLILIHPPWFRRLPSPQYWAGRPPSYPILLLRAPASVHYAPPTPTFTRSNRPSRPPGLLASTTLFHSIRLL